METAPSMQAEAGQRSGRAMPSADAEDTTGGTPEPALPQTERVSVVIPCRNEVRYIGRCLDNLIAGRVDTQRLEILVVDGMSDDGTRECVETYARRHPFIRMIDNPARITPVALNTGIRAARGDIVIRADAHASYPDDYIPKLLDWMRRAGADNVGGVLVTRPGAEGPMAAAIAIVVSHPFGVGNAYFRIGTSKPRWVDTVPFGCWRKSTFAQIGLFDEELVRNQDDELNFRLQKAGGKLLLVPDIVVEYFVRGKLSQLWQMYAQYGYFKPLVAKKVGSVVTVRQLVPAAFVATVALSALAAPFTVLAAAALIGSTATYTVANLVASVMAARSNPRLILYLPAAFATVHVAYGTGFLRGVWDFMIRRRTAGTRPRALPLSR